MGNKLQVLFAAAECAPYIKVGGLGDVTGELPLKLNALGTEIVVILPRYSCIKAESELVARLSISMGKRKLQCAVWQIKNTPVKTYLIENTHYFDRPLIYGYPDDRERFACFCLTVYEMLKTGLLKPDLLHLHDWHTAPLSMLLRENETKYPHLANISIVYTIHSLEYQGLADESLFKLYRLKDAVFSMDKVEYYGNFNPMKAGIYYSDIINAVSQTYAKQMMTRDLGFGLDGFIKKRKEALRGIVNGIDTEYWNPEKDNFIDAPYNAASLHLKKNNKTILKRELGLLEGDQPLFGMVSRLVPSKGLDLLEGAVETLISEGGQLVLLGTGEEQYEKILLKLRERYPKAVSVILGFNERMAHRIYSAADIFLMPSKYEPCGLSQLIAMRYGSIPVVHKTGGLADTVLNVTNDVSEGTGFTFSRYSKAAFDRSIKRAIALYKSDRLWGILIKRAMEKDSSWDKQALEYLNLYHEAMHINTYRKEKGIMNLDEKKR